MSWIQVEEHNISLEALIGNFMYLLGIHNGTFGAFKGATFRGVSEPRVKKFECYGSVWEYGRYFEDHGDITRFVKQ